MITIFLLRIEKHATPGVSILLVGTKCDLERKVPEEKVIEISEEYSIPWIETR